MLNKLIIASCLVVISSGSFAQNCEPGERALYKGLTEKKQVLICASPAKQPFQKIEYRFGTADKVELTYTADKTNGKKFFVSHEAIDQRSALEYVGFNNGDTNYTIAQCNGGNCPQDSNLLIVAKGKKIIAKIKLKESNFIFDGVTDFEKSLDGLIEVKDFFQFDIMKAFGV